MESTFLNLIDFQLLVKSGEYARYYFVLRTFAKTLDCSHRLNPIGVETVLNLQRKGGNAEMSMKAMYADSLFKTL